MAQIFVESSRGTEGQRTTARSSLHGYGGHGGGGGGGGIDRRHFNDKSKAAQKREDAAKDQFDAHRREQQALQVIDSEHVQQAPEVQQSIDGGHPHLGRGTSARQH